MALIGCSSQLGELADDVLLLWLLRLLMLGGEEDAIEPEAAINGLERHGKGKLALGRLAGHEPLELHVVVAIERHAGFQAGRHLEGIETVAHSAVHAEAAKHFSLLSHLSSLLSHLQKSKVHHH